jgi:CheY-like chemotaxis protein
MNRILLIEDNRDVRENTAEILEMAGYKVLATDNGKKGVDMAIKHLPDLIICDIMMPVLDGYGTLHLLSKNPDTANIPFIFLTAKTERSDMRKGMEMGADDYITKPFDKLELLNAVESRLKKVESLKKEYKQSFDGLSSFVADMGGKNALQKFLQNKKVNHYRKKENIYMEGNFAGGMYCIVKGKVKTFKTHQHGKDLIIDLLQDGQFFGYADILLGDRYSESAQALEDSEIIYIPRDEIQPLILNNREVAGKFLRILTKNLADRHEHMLKIAYSSVRRRVAEALIYLQDKFKTENTEPFKIALTREELANIVGTATESLIRTLSDFKDEKLIDIREGKIYILNESKLRNLKS